MGDGENVEEALRLFERVKRARKCGGKVARRRSIREKTWRDSWMNSSSNAR